MSLREILQTTHSDGRYESTLGVLAAGGGPSHDIKMRIHQEMLDRIDLAALDALPPDRLRLEVGTLVERLVAEEGLVVNDAERRMLVRDIQFEMLGLGPLELLLDDPTISDILINGHRNVFV